MFECLSVDIFMVFIFETDLQMVKISENNIKRNTLTNLSE